MGTPPAERMRKMRARKAASLEAVPDEPRDPAELLLPSVEATLAALRLGERDLAQAQLARAYAAAIDEAGSRVAALRALGPPLARVLAELGRSAGRRRPERAAPSKVAQLRAAHAKAKARQRRGA